MTIRISRERGSPAYLRRVRVEVDRVEVARLWPGQHVDIEGTGSLQEVRARLDWTASRPLAVSDPGSPAVVDVVVGFPAVVRYLVLGLSRPEEALTIGLE